MLSDAGQHQKLVYCHKTRKKPDRFCRFPIEDLLKRDKLNLDLFWLKDDAPEDIDSPNAKN